MRALMSNRDGYDLFIFTYEKFLGEITDWLFDHNFKVKQCTESYFYEKVNAKHPRCFMFKEEEHGCLYNFLDNYHLPDSLESRANE